MQITAIQAAERLNQIFLRLQTSKFSERCSLLESIPRNSNALLLNLALDYADPIINLVDILKYSDFPNDTMFYEKLYSFCDPRVLIGLKSCIFQSITYLKQEGNQLYEVPENDYAFFHDYAFIAFT